MNRLKRGVVYSLPLFLLALGCAAPASAVGLGAKFQFWYPTVKGDIRGDGGGVTGTVMDIDGDLGLDATGSYAVEATGQFGKHRLTLNFNYFDWSGEERLGRPVVFGGATFAAGSVVESDLRTRVLNLEYEYDFFRIDAVLAGLSTGVIGKFIYVDGDVELRSAALDRTINFSYPIPAVGLAAHLGLIAKILEAHVKAAGMAYSDTTYYDLDASVSLTLIPLTDIAVGYKYTKFDVDQDGVLLDTELSGPYVSLTIGF